MILLGLSIVTPPSASMSRRKPAKPTTITWLIGTPRPSSSCTVRIVSAGRPASQAAWLLPQPRLGRGRAGLRRGQALGELVVAAAATAAAVDAVVRLVATCHAVRVASPSLAGCQAKAAGYPGGRMADHVIGIDLGGTKIAG